MTSSNKAVDAVHIALALGCHRAAVDGAEHDFAIGINDLTSSNKAVDAVHIAEVVAVLLEQVCDRHALGVFGADGHCVFVQLDNNRQLLSGFAAVRVVVVSRLGRSVECEVEESHGTYCLESE